MTNSSFRPNVPYHPALKDKAREMRNNPTTAEKHFWNALRESGLTAKWKFLRQKPLGEYIVDFYCPALRLVVEIDGDTHAEESEQEYDERRTRFLESEGLTVLRFTNRDILEAIAGVLSVLEEWIETH